MLASYLGLHESPPWRPDWRRHALWVVPAALTLAVYVIATVPGIGQILGWLAAIAFVAVIAFMSAVRAQYVRLLDEHPRISSTRAGVDDDAS